MAVCEGDADKKGVAATVMSMGVNDGLEDGVVDGSIAKADGDAVTDGDTLDDTETLGVVEIEAVTDGEGIGDIATSHVLFARFSPRKAILSKSVFTKRSEVDAHESKAPSSISSPTPTVTTVIPSALIVSMGFSPPRL